MKVRPLFLASGLAALACASLPASAALFCDADLVSLDFGLISVRDGLSQQTSGPVTISCSGGTPGASVVRGWPRWDAPTATGSGSWTRWRFHGSANA